MGNAPLCETECPVDSPKPRCGHSAHVINGRMYTFGGWGKGGDLNDIDVLELEGLVWYPIRPSGPPPPRSGASDKADTRLVTVSGGDVFYLDTVSRDTRGCYCTFAWVKPTTLGTAPEHSEGESLTYCNGRFFLFGFKGLFCLRDSSFEWEDCRIFGSVPTSRGFHTMTAVGTSLVLCGGRNQSDIYLDDVWNLDITTLQWSKLKVSGTAPPRRLHTATLLPNECSEDQSIICFGGEAQDRQVLGGAFILNLCGKSNRWAFRRFANKRCGHSAVLLNASEILIFGGHDGQKIFERLYRGQFKGKGYF